MNPSTKRGHVATARTAGRDASSTRPPKARIRVLIADDHGVVREGELSCGLGSHEEGGWA